METIANLTSFTTIKACPNCDCIIEIKASPEELNTQVVCSACQETFWIDRQGNTMRIFTSALWEETLLLFKMEEKMEEFSEKNKYYK